MQAITEAMIKRLVDAFYSRVRADPGLGPVFEAAIGENWDRHLAAMVGFWGSVLLTNGRHAGNPLAYQSVAGSHPELFPRWFELFALTTREQLPPEVAAVFRAKARRIGDSLSRGLFDLTAPS